MRSVAARLLCVSGLVAAVAIGLAAQQQPPVGTIDSRVGLKAGFRDAGEAAKNMEHIATLPKPEGFFDPAAPAGRGSVPESQADGRGGRAANEPPPPPPGTPPPFDPVASNRLGFTNSDLAFSGNHVIVGNYHGFNTYEVERPNRPKLVASVVCPGGQGDVSIHGHLLFMSVEQTRGRLDCGTEGVPTPVLSTALYERFSSRNNADFQDKLLSAMRYEFGGHIEKPD